MRFLGVVAIMLLGTLLSLVSPIAAACLFLWHDIFQPFTFSYHSVDFSTANIVFIILVASSLLAYIKGSTAVRANPFVYLTFLFLFWIYICALKSPYSEAMDGFLTITKYFLPLILISTLINRKSDALWLTGTLALSVGLWSVQAGIKGLMSGVIKNMAIPGGQMSDNNDFMVATVSIVPLISYFAFNYSGPLKKIIRGGLLPAIILCLCAIAFSNSRGAAVGLAVTFVIYILMISKHRMRDSAAVAILLIAGYFLLPPEFFERMSTIDLSVNQTEDSAAERVFMAISAWHASLQSPIFGYGPLCWTIVAPAFANGKALEPHNNWMKLTTEVGFVGALIFLIIFCMTIFRLFSVRKKAILSEEYAFSGLASTLITSLFGFLSAATFVSHPYSEFLWALMAVSNGYASSYSRKASGVIKKLSKRKRSNQKRNPGESLSLGQGQGLS